LTREIYRFGGEVSIFQSFQAHDVLDLTFHPDHAELSVRRVFGMSTARIDADKLALGVLFDEVPPPASV
jgi:hypothetical protein